MRLDGVALLGSLPRQQSAAGFHPSCLSPLYLDGLASLPWLLEKSFQSLGLSPNQYRLRPRSCPSRQAPAGQRDGPTQHRPPPLPYADRASSRVCGNEALQSYGPSLLNEIEWSQRPNDQIIRHRRRLQGSLRHMRRLSQGRRGMFITYVPCLSNSLRTPILAVLLWWARWAGS